MPDLEEMQSLLPDDYMLLLGSDEELGKVRKFADESGFDMNFVSLKVSLESLGIYSLPTTLIIDNEGNLKERIVGAQAWNTQKQIDKIKSAVQ